MWFAVGVEHDQPADATVHQPAHRIPQHRLPRYGWFSVGDAIGYGLGRRRNRDEAHPTQDVAGAHEIGNEVIGRIADYLERRIDLDDLAIAHDDDAVGQPDGLLDVMRHEENGLLELPMDTLKFVLKPHPGDRVQRAERLVHEHGGWFRRQRPGQANPLLFASRQLIRIAPIVGSRRQPDEFEKFIDPVPRARLVPFQKTRNNGHIVPDPHVGKEPGLLDHVADRAA